MLFSVTVGGSTDLLMLSVGSGATFTVSCAVYKEERPAPPAVTVLVIEDPSVNGA